MYLCIKSYEITEFHISFQSSTKNSAPKPVEKPVETVNNMTQNVRNTRKVEISKMLKIVEKLTFRVENTCNLL